MKDLFFYLLFIGMGFAAAMLIVEQRASLSLPSFCASNKHLHSHLHRLQEKRGCDADAVMTLAAQLCD